MTQQTTLTNQDLDLIEVRLSQRGLLMRQHRGRIRQFWLRQVLTLVGALTLWLMVGPVIGLAALCVALLGESIDILVLRRNYQRLNSGAQLRSVKIETTISATFQAATIAACVAMARIGLPSESGAFFAYAFLAGAAMNAGIFIYFHPASATARLSVYALTFAYFLGIDISAQNATNDGQYLSAASALILAGMTYAFVTFSRHTHAKNHQASLELLDQNRLLTGSNDMLRSERANARRLAMVAQHANDSVMMTDRDGFITWVNDGFHRTTGYTFEDAVGQRPSELLNSPETDIETSKAITQAIIEGRPHRAEILNRTKSGTDIWIETNSVPILDDAGVIQTVIAIERDITIAKQHEADLDAARARAERGEREKSSFLATISHEIRTPMNAIMGMSELLAAAKLGKEEKLYATTIRDASSALLELLNDSLDLSKIDAGKLEIASERLDLKETVQGSVNMFLATATTKGVDLKTDFASDLPEFVLGDAQRIRQILANLVGNALKFTEKGSVTISMSCETAGKSSRVKIKVADTGIGIPEDRIDAVFKEFSQGESDTSKTYGGTGLGLSICRRLAEMMGGGIELSSTVGVGSEFVATIQVALTQTPQTTSPAAPEPADISGMRVMVVDDNATNRLLIKKFLKGTELATCFAENGQEAFNKSEEFNPDLILMDYSMPVMNGAEAATEIRRITPPFSQPVIVALTANDDENTRQECENAGMDAFMTKPIRKADLLQCLSTHAAQG